MSFTMDCAVLRFSKETCKADKMTSMGLGSGGSRDGLREASQDSGLRVAAQAWWIWGATEAVEGFGEIGSWKCGGEWRRVEEESEKKRKNERRTRKKREAMERVRNLE